MAYNAYDPYVNNVNNYQNGYSSGYPAGYQYDQRYTQTNQMPRQQLSMKADWALGESAARAYPVSPGMLTLLMDTERPTLYVKQTDATGRPYPLEVYDLVKREVHAVPQQEVIPAYSQANNVPALPQAPDMSEYVRRDELEREVSDIVKRSMGQGQAGGST